MLTTAREPDELITAVRFPVDGRRGAAFREVARRHGDFAMLAVAAVIEDERLASGSASAAWPAAPWCDASRSMAASDMKDAVETLAAELPKATRTCTRPPSCGAISCAIWPRS